jgi:purine catabolism regulator
VLLLRDLIRDLDVRLVAGEAGLDRPVRWVHISELSDPTPWLSGGELLLTTGMNLAEPTAQRAYVERLAAHDLAGLGLGTGFAHAEMPAALREAAAELGFPLFEIPYEVPFIALTEKAFSHLVNEQYAVLQRALSAHERLERIVLSEQGLEGVTAALASLIGGTALVCDARGAELARSDGAAALGAAVLEATRDEVRERARAGARRGYAPSGELHGRALALPVVRTPAGNGEGPAPQAWLVAVKDRGGLAEFDRLVLHQAVTVVALELLRRRVADDTERRLAGDVLSAMVSGELAGAELTRRLEPFGLHERVGVLVLAPPRCARRCRAGWRPAPASSPARCCRWRAARARRTCSRSPSASGRAPRAPPGWTCPPAPAVRSRRPTCGARSTRRAARSRRRRSPARATATARSGCSRRSATWARSSCCSRSRTTTRCGSSATRSSPRSRTARAPTAAS